MVLIWIQETMARIKSGLQCKITFSKFAMKINEYNAIHTITSYPQEKLKFPREIILVVFLM